MLLIKQGLGNGKRIGTKPNFNPSSRAVFVWRLEDCSRDSLILHSADTPGPTCSLHQLFNLISVQWLAQLVSLTLVPWIMIYSVACAIQRLNNQGMLLTSEVEENQFSLAFVASTEIYGCERGRGAQRRHLSQWRHLSSRVSPSRDLFFLTLSYYLYMFFISAYE